MLLVMAACSGESGLAPSTVTDSAGVMIVTHGQGSLAAAETWALAPDPVVNVGSGTSPETALLRVVDVTPLGSDRVAIAMAAPPSVIIANPDGTRAVTLGAEGDGPGEFAGVRSLVHMEPDSLAVWDAERRRISVFTEDGRFHREVVLTEVAPLSWIASPNVVEESGRVYLLPSSPGSFVLFGIGVLGAGEGVRRVTLPSLRISTTGDVITDVGAFPGETTFSSEQTGVTPYPLGPDTHVAALGDRFVAGTAETEEYRRYAPDGTLEQIVRWPPSDTLLTDSDRGAWESFLDRWLGAMPPQEAASIREILDVMPEPARRPAYSGLITSDVGSVWVGEYHPGQLELGSAYMGRMRVPERRWLVFGQSDATLTATVRMPDGFRPFTVEDGRVWGVHTDDLDVESVRAYEIGR
jgi:hypothetical protein